MLPALQGLSTPCPFLRHTCIVFCTTLSLACQFTPSSAGKHLQRQSKLPDCKSTTFDVGTAHLRLLL